MKVRTEEGLGQLKSTFWKHIGVNMDSGVLNLKSENVLSRCRIEHS